MFLLLSILHPILGYQRSYPKDSLTHNMVIHMGRSVHVTIALVPAASLTPFMHQEYCSCETLAHTNQEPRAEGKCLFRICISIKWHQELARYRVTLRFWHCTGPETSF